MGSQEPTHIGAVTLGSLDGDGAGDHDQAYRFGWRPRASAPYPFNTRQYMRLLVMRSRIHELLPREGVADSGSWRQVAA